MKEYMQWIKIFNSIFIPAFAGLGMFVFLVYYVNWDAFTKLFYSLITTSVIGILIGLGFNK